MAAVFPVSRPAVICHPAPDHVNHPERQMTEDHDRPRRVAVLGTGLMGAPMARRLAAAGHDLVLWNRSPGPLAGLAGLGSIAETPAAAARGADIILAMLLDGPVTRAVLQDGGVLAACRPGAVIIDMGSVDPATDIALAGLARARGLGYLDAPVSGGVAGAEAGTLAILAGGDAADLALVAPLLAVLGRVTHLGPVGAGQVAKLANQLIVGTTIGAVAEAFALAAAAGCNPAALRQALRGGFADSRILELHGDRMIRADYRPGGRSSVQLKDLENVQDLARQHGLDLPLAQTAADAYRDLVENHGGADLDHAAYYLWLSLRHGA